MDQVSEIKSKVDIVEVIRENITLKKAGRNYKGLCPFHNEKTPSFMVNPELQIFKCFGCGESGDVISFLEKYEGIEFYDALQVLAERVGVELTKYKFDNATHEKQKLIEINTEAARLYHFILLKHRLGKEFLDYAKKTRGFSDLAIKTFEIGAAPKTRQILVNHLKKKGYSLDDIEKAGLAFRSSNGVFDRFWGRLMFPIQDHRGAVIALAGRILPQYDTGNTGKYINSPETLIYKKSESLYGLSETKQDIKKAKMAIVVEGEIDLVSCWQGGARNVVAIKGSAFTQEQATLLSRFCDEVVLALDSDFAGDKAAFAGIEILHKTGINTKVSLMGKYKDPDEMARADLKGFREAIKNAVSVWDFMIKSVLKRYDFKTGEGKAKASRGLMPILAAIEDRIVLAHYVKQLGDKLDIPDEAIMEQLESFRKQGQVVPIAKERVLQQKNEENKREVVESRLLSMIFQKVPELAVEVEEYIETVFCKRVLAEFIKYMQKKKKFEPREFYEELPEELREGFSRLFMLELEFNEDPSREINKAIIRIKLIGVVEEMEGLARELKKAEQAGNEEGMNEHKEKFLELGRIRAELENE